MLANLSESDLRLLRVFAKVVEAGGYSAAQIELNVSQSTISTHMTELEHRLGVRLCQRGRSGFSVTEKGRLIYQASLRLSRRSRSSGPRPEPRAAAWSANFASALSTT
jgi:DNA-binding transcriptional LysR family regulator